MKKGIYIMLILVLTLSLGMANVPATTQQSSTPLSVQEMSSIYGGENCIFCDANGRLCGTFDAWIFTITICVYDFLGICSAS